MRRIIAFFLCLILMMLSVTPVVAEDEREEKYGVLKVEFSDAIGNIEYLDVMVQNDHVYVNARELASRFGYQISDTNKECVTIYNTENSGLPYTLTQFFYGNTKVKHLLFLRMLESYKAPFPSIYNEKGAWIPLEYSLLILNSGMLIIDDTVLIDMPEKRITDIYLDIMKNHDVYTFDWEKDFGYTSGEVGAIGASSHLVNQFNGLLKFDGDSWVQLFQSFTMDSSSYDKKYGENLAMLLCTESNSELERVQEEVEKYQDVFSKEGKIGQLLSEYSNLLDSDVDAMYKTCSNILEDVKKGNSSVATYNKAYSVLEKAFNKQTWFSKTGGVILDMQGSIADVVPILDVGVKIAEVVRYGQEFVNQDEFSIEALDRFLLNTIENTGAADVVKQSMRNYSLALKSNLVEYSAKRFFEENIDDWIGEAIKDGKLLGGQANMALIAWDLASDYVPFISNGLSAADKFELALYSSILQSDAFINYQNFRNNIFADEANITVDNLYVLSQYSYIYMKLCYITRDAAIASLAGKGKDIKEQIQPLIDYQNGINSDIAEILVMLKKADKSNENLVYGFLPSDNEDYLKVYSDEKVGELIHDNIEIDGADIKEGMNDNTLSEADICGAIHRASRFAWDWFWDSSRDHVDENDTYFEVDEYGYNWEYKRVTYEGVYCVEDVVNLAKHYFTEDIAREIVSYKQWYESGDGLYVSEPDGIGGADADYYDIIIRKDTEKQYTITMYEYFVGELIGEPYEIHYKLVDGYWVFDRILLQIGSDPIPINVIEDGSIKEKETLSSPADFNTTSFSGRISLYGTLCYAEDGNVVLKLENPTRFYGENGTKYEIEEVGIGNWEETYYEFIDKKVLITGEAVEAHTQYHYRDLMILVDIMSAMDND